MHFYCERVHFVVVGGVCHVLHFAQKKSIEAIQGQNLASVIRSSTDDISDKNLNRIKIIIASLHYLIFIATLSKYMCILAIAGRAQYASSASPILAQATNGVCENQNRN